mgnify:CR=1 FL=1
MLTGKQTRAWLEQYPYLVAKVNRLQREIESIRGRQVICGVVQASSPYSPYAKHSVVVSDSTATDESKAKLPKKRMELEQAQDEVEEIERYISHEPDLKMKEILTRKILYGEKWPEVAAAFGYKETADSVRMTYSRYFSR